MPAVISYRLLSGSSRKLIMPFVSAAGPADVCGTSASRFQSISRILVNVVQVNESTPVTATNRTRRVSRFQTQPNHDAGYRRLTANWTRRWSIRPVNDSTAGHLACCGRQTVYDRRTEVCCDGSKVEPGGPTVRCCGSIAYDTQHYYCRNGRFCLQPCRSMWRASDAGDHNAIESMKSLCPRNINAVCAIERTALIGF